MIAIFFISLDDRDLRRTATEPIALIKRTFESIALIKRTLRYGSNCRIAHFTYNLLIIHVGTYRILSGESQTVNLQFTSLHMMLCETNHLIQPYLDL